MTKAKALRDLGVMYLAAAAWLLMVYSVGFLTNPAWGFLFGLITFAPLIKLLGDLMGWLDRN